MSTGRSNDMGMDQWQRQFPTCPTETYIQLGASFVQCPFDFSGVQRKQLCRDSCQQCYRDQASKLTKQQSTFRHVSGTLYIHISSLPPRLNIYQSDIHLGLSGI